MERMLEGKAISGDEKTTATDNGRKKTMQPKLLTERDACKYLSCSRSFLAGSRMGDLPGRTPGPPWVRLGHGIRYSLDDLDKWIEEHRQSPRSFPTVK